MLLDLFAGLDTSPPLLLAGIIGLQLFMGVPEHNCAALMNPRPECIGCEAPFPSLADGLLPGDLPYLSNLTNFARYIGAL